MIDVLRFWMGTSEVSEFCIEYVVYVVVFLILFSMSPAFRLGRSGILVRHNMSRRFWGLDIAICICWKWSWPFRVSLYILWRSFFFKSDGWYFQWMYRVSSDGIFGSRRFLFPCVLSIDEAAERMAGMMSSIVWPRWIRRWINCCVMLIKSSCCVFWRQYRSISPVIRPLNLIYYKHELQFLLFPTNVYQ